MQLHKEAVWRGFVRGAGCRGGIVDLVQRLIVGSLLVLAAATSLELAVIAVGVLDVPGPSHSLAGA